MNTKALDALARPVVMNPVVDMPPFVQSLKDQAAAKGETNIDQYFHGDNKRLTVQELQAREDEKAFMLGQIDYAQQTLPSPEEQLRNGALAMPNGGAVPMGGQQPQPAQPGTPLVAGQAQYSRSPETIQREQDLANAQGQSPQMRQVERKPVSQRDAIFSTILATLFPQQSTGILQAPGAQNDRQYQEDSQKAQNQFAIDDKSHKQRLDVLKTLLESAMDGDQRRFEQDKFNTGERNDMAVQTRGQDIGLQKNVNTQEGQNYRADVRADSSSLNTLIRQAFGADMPEARYSAATTLKARYGFDVHDPESLKTLAPAERLAAERSADLREKRPHEIDRIKSVIKVNKERAAKIHQEVEHFPEILRIKLGMLKGYLANIQSMIEDRTLDREQRGEEFYNKEITGELAKAEKEMGELKDTKRDLQTERQKYRDALSSGYYTEDGDRKYAEKRLESLNQEIADLDDQITVAEGDVEFFRNGGEQNALPVTGDTSKGFVVPNQGKPPISGPIVNRRGRRAEKASLGPFKDVV